MTDFRALCQELMDAIDSGIPVERIKQSPLAVRTEAALAQPEPQAPSDKELLGLIPEIMRDEFSYAARVCSDMTGVAPGIFRVSLNIAALEYARAVLTKYLHLEQCND
jgi:hypothetical protein